MSNPPPLSYYNWLKKVGGKQAAIHFGAGSNNHPDIDKEFKQLFKEWKAEWKKQGLIPERKRRKLKQ